MCGFVVVFVDVYEINQFQADITLSRELSCKKCWLENDKYIFFHYRLEYISVECSLFRVHIVFCHANALLFVNFHCSDSVLDLGFAII